MVIRIVKFNIILFCFILFFINDGITKAQTSDFQIWTTAGISKKITKDISLSIEQELRFYNNASFAKKYFTDIGVNYELLKFIDISLNYRFIKNRENNSLFETQNRYYTDICLKRSFNRFRFSFRTRYQVQQENKINKEMGEPTDIYNRNKLSIKYNIPKFPVSPNISSELFYQFDKAYGNKFDKVRFQFGLEYSILKDHKIEIYYMFQHEIMQAEPEKTYILGLSYSYEF